MEEPDGTPETKWKLTWTQKVSKKGANWATLEMMKIELPLQRELDPACSRHPKKSTKFGLSLESTEM